MFLTTKIWMQIFMSLMICNEFLHIWFLKMPFHSGIAKYVSQPVHEHVILIEHIFLLESIYRILLDSSLDIDFLI